MPVKRTATKNAVTAYEETRVTLQKGTQGGVHMSRRDRDAWRRVAKELLP